MGQVTTAAFLGTPLAGAALISLNFRSIDKNKESKKALGLGIAYTLALIAIVAITPIATPGLTLSIAAMIGVQQWYRKIQEKEYYERITLGWKKGNWIFAIGVGVLSLGLITGLDYAISSILPST